MRRVVLLLLLVVAVLLACICWRVSENVSNMPPTLDMPADAKALPLSGTTTLVARHNESAPPRTVKSRFAVKTAKDFMIGIFVQPNKWFVDLETDMKALSKIANTLFVTAGRYRTYQERYLEPLLDSALVHGMKVVLIYGKIEDGDTSLESLVKHYGDNSAVIGFYVKGEVGSRGESAQFWLDRLAQARQIVRKHSSKPVMIDIIPWEFWKEGNAYYERKFPAAKHAAIDQYIDKGLIDWLIISLGDHVEKSLPLAMKRWGNKVPLIIRTSGSFKGDTYKLTPGSDPKIAQARARFAFTEGAIGIHYYAWKHGDWKILNFDGGSNPLYVGLRESYAWFQQSIE